MNDITMQQVEENHAFNPHRQQLLAKLKAELNAWDGYLAAFDIWLFGSYVTAKAEPGDIDILLAGRLKAGTPFPPKLPRLHTNDIHVISNLGTAGLATRDELITKFNEQEGNAEKGIQLSGGHVAKVVL